MGYPYYFGLPKVLTLHLWEIIKKKYIMCNKKELKEVSWRNITPDITTNLVNSMVGVCQQLLVPMELLRNIDSIFTYSRIVVKFQHVLSQLYNRSLMKYASNLV